MAITPNANFCSRSNIITENVLELKQSNLLNIILKACYVTVFIRIMQIQTHNYVCIIRESPVLKKYRMFHWKLIARRKYFFNHILLKLGLLQSRNSLLFSLLEICHSVLGKYIAVSSSQRQLHFSVGRKLSSFA